MTCCIIGRGLKDFPYPRDAFNRLFSCYVRCLEREVENLIQQGCNHFISDMEEGVDLDFAAVVVELKKVCPDIILEAVISRSDAGKNSLRRRSEIMKSVDKVTYIPACSSECYVEKRYKYMVQRSNVVFAMWDGSTSGHIWNAIQYAKKQYKYVIDMFF